MSYIAVSIRDLVEFTLRSGSLGGGGFAGPRRAAEGVRGHKKLQQLRPAEYQAELSVSHRFDVNGQTIELNGRIDGVMPTARGVMVEEIKTVEGAPVREMPDNPVHWAQAKVYACIIALEQNLEAIDVQLAYVRLDGWDVYEVRRSFLTSDLSDYVADILTKYLHWTAGFYAWPIVRDRTIKSLFFPYPAYRPGQRALAAAIYRTIASKGRLYAQAPTGIGKTISALFPAMKAMGEGLIEKIFYLTSKTTQCTAAEKALADLRSQGLSIKSVTLTARDKICFKPDGFKSCDPEQCEFAIGYFDRINDALKETLEQDCLTRATIEAAARTHRICPFELSLDLSLWTDVVICDYNYVFDPRVYLRRFFQDRTGRYAFLIDEAHNLVDRAREMFSAELSKQEILDLRRSLKLHQPGLAKRLNAINAYLLKIRKLCDQDEENESWVDQGLPEELMPELKKFTRDAEETLKTLLYAPYREALIDFYFKATAFQRIAELYDDHYVTYAQRQRKDVRLRLYCLDPSELIRNALKRGTSATFFSATLKPMDYFRDILGGEESDTLLDLPSPFPPDHLCILLADHVNTTFKMRDDSYDEIAEHIAAVADKRAGNYIVYFPSYRYMACVVDRFRAVRPGIPIIIQETGMDETAREAFLDKFRVDPTETTVGFAVMGGIFGEGIDLVGDRLIGAVIVGVGLPQLCLERELIRAYFNGLGYDGFAYAYMYPGMNRALQAAGRVIRSSDDRGILLLVDQRFGQSRYRRLFPTGWRHPQPARGAAQVTAVLDAFWDG